LVNNTWRDGSQNVVKFLPAGSQIFAKTVFDSLGRTVITYTGFGNDATYGAIISVASNTILEQLAIAYDNGDNTIQSTLRQRYHNADASQFGALGDPQTAPNARVTYAAFYPDALGRLVAAANFGTNGGGPLSRPGTAPARSDTCLV